MEVLWVHEAMEAQTNRCFFNWIWQEWAMETSEGQPCGGTVAHARPSKYQHAETGAANSMTFVRFAVVLCHDH